MKVLAIVFAVLAAASGAGVWWLVQLAGGTGLGLAELYVNAHPLTKLTDLSIGLMTVATLVLGLVRGKGGAPIGGALLRLMIWLAAGLGLLAALQAGLSTWRAAAMVHVTDLRVVAPGLAEALIPFLLGCICAALAAALSPSSRPATAAVFE